jgi:MYXO-CTERM domain-containing protein
LARDFASLGAWGAGALFIPALALASGVWTGGRKMFEILYLVLWYGGPMNKTPELDFMGVTAAGAASQTPMIFLGVALALLVLAAVGRTRQLRG